MNVGVRETDFWNMCKGSKYNQDVRKLQSIPAFYRLHVFSYNRELIHFKKDYRILIQLGA